MNDKQNIIHEWSESLKFEDLNNNQQKLVLQAMSVEEYDQLYGLNRAFGSHLKADKSILEPNVMSLPKLKAKIDNRVEKPLIVALWSWPMPFYTTIAASLFFFVLSFLLFGLKTEWKGSGVAGNEVVHTIKDTIYLERPKVEPKVETIYVPVVAKSPRTNLNTHFDLRDKTIEVEYSPAPTAEGISKSYGNSAVDLSRLEQFKVRI